jgi:hypothetical protein
MAECSFHDASGTAGARWFYTKYNKWWGTYYSGGYRCMADYSLALPASAMAECLTHGPTAWAKYRPAQPVVSMSVFIAELREVPQLMFKRLNRFRNYGSNYLAVEFGWKPFLRDLRKWWASLGEVDRLIQQLRRNNGRRMRRGGTLFTNTDTLTTMDLNARWIYPSLEIVTWNTGYKTVTTEEKCWFAGSFRYFIPGLDHPVFGKWKAIQHLYDLEISPEQVWELMPYSWLVDWFSNLGDVIGNLCASWSDNVTADYAYIMQSKRRVESYSQDFVTQYKTERYGTYTYTDHTADSTFTTHTKCRGVAKPYGFSLNWTDLSWRQRAILAALGITKLKF